MPGHPAPDEEEASGEVSIDVRSSEQTTLEQSSCNLQAPPHPVTLTWVGLDPAGPVTAPNGTLALRATSDRDGVGVFASVRIDADGQIISHDTTVAELDAGESTQWQISAADLGVDVQALQFAAMLETRATAVHDGHTRFTIADPIYIHPDQETGDVLAYGEAVLVDQFGGGNFRGLVDFSDDPAIQSGETQVGHVGVARVEVLPPGAELELD